MRAIRAALAATVVMILFVSPLRWLWPYMIEWYGFPIMLLWFYAAIHSATKAALFYAHD